MRLIPEISFLGLPDFFDQTPRLPKFRKSNGVYLPGKIAEPATWSAREMTVRIVTDTWCKETGTELPKQMLQIFLRSCTEA